MVLYANLCQQAERPGGDAEVQGLIIAHKWQINRAQPEASSISRHRAANLLTFLGSFILAGALGREIQIVIAVSLFQKEVEGRAGHASLATFLYRGEDLPFAA